MIAEKIYLIENLKQGAVGNVRDKKNQEIAKELQAIGRAVLLLPQSFTKRYSDVPWGEMSDWACLNPSLESLSDSQLSTMEFMLDKAEHEISRHVYANIEIQKEEVQSLNNTLAKCSTEWYSHNRLPNLLVYATAVALLIRIQMDGINVSPWQGAIYTMNILYALIIVFVVQLSAKFPNTYFSATEYFTSTEFFDTKTERLEVDISEANKRLEKRKKAIVVYSIVWLATFLLAIMITLIEANSTHGSTPN